LYKGKNNIFLIKHMI